MKSEIKPTATPAARVPHQHKGCSVEQKLRQAVPRSQGTVWGRRTLPVPCATYESAQRCKCKTCHSNLPEANTSETLCSLGSGGSHSQTQSLTAWLQERNLPGNAAASTRRKCWAAPEIGWRPAHTAPRRPRSAPGQTGDTGDRRALALFCCLSSRAQTPTSQRKVAAAITTGQRAALREVSTPG